LWSQVHAVSHSRPQLIFMFEYFRFLLSLQLFPAVSTVWLIVAGFAVLGRVWVFGEAPTELELFGWAVWGRERAAIEDSDGLGLEELSAAPKSSSRRDACEGVLDTRPRSFSIQNNKFSILRHKFNLLLSASLSVLVLLWRLATELWNQVKNQRRQNYQTMLRWTRARPRVRFSTTISSSVVGIFKGSCVFAFWRFSKRID